METQVEAHANIKEMSDSLDNGQIVHRSTEGYGWDAAIHDILHQKKAPTPPGTLPDQTSPAQPNMAGLQHLAAAAVGEREGADARPSSSSGNGAAASNQSRVDPDLQAAMNAANAAAKAQQAMAAAAEQEMPDASTNGGSSNNYDTSALIKDGF